MLFYFVTIFVVLMDQISKSMIRAYVAIGEPFSMMGIEMTHIENSGMARSLFPGYGRLFGLIAVLFVAGILYYRRTSESKGFITETSLGFLAGGAAGNAADRLLYGQVTDFIVSRSGRGVLNLADYAIEIGVLLFILNGVIQYIKRKI